MVIWIVLYDITRWHKHPLMIKYNLLSFKLEDMKNTSNSHLKENSSIAAPKLHYVSQLCRM
jgi:hypothetical protein